MTHPKLIKDPAYERWRWTVFAVTWVSYAGFYLTRKGLSVAQIGMLKDPHLHIDKAALGAIDAALLTAYAIGQFVWGISGDKLGARKVVMWGLLASVAAGLAMGASSTVLAFSVIFFIQGLCQSTGWAPLTKNMGCWFSRRERGRVFGWWCTNYAIGGMIASPFAGLAAEHFLSWRYAFYVPAATLFFIWVLFVIFQRNRPEDMGLCPIEEYHAEPPAVLAADAPKEAEEGSWQAVFEVMKNRMVLLLSAVYFFLKPTRYAILLWGPLIVSEKLGTGMAKSGLISVVFEAAGPIGVLASGYISDKLLQSRRMPVCVVSLLLLSAVLFSSDMLTGSVWAMGIFLFLVGFFLFGPDSLIVGTAAVDFGTKKGASTAAGLINGFGSIGAILGGSLPGVISQKYGWDVLFYILGASVLVSGLLLLPKWNAVPPTAGKCQ